MISINNGCYINVEMEGLEGFNHKMFKYLILSEEIGLIDPLFELALIQSDYSLYPFLVKSKVSIKITYGTQVDNSITRTFTVGNYNYVSNDSEGMMLIITGSLNNKEFNTNPKIRSFSKLNFSEVLKKIDTIGLDIRYESDDIQTYIQHNISDKKFVMNSLLRSCTKETHDLVLGALSIDKELIVSSLKSIYKEEPKKEFHQAEYKNNPKKVKFDYLKVESDASLWVDQFSEGKSLPVFHIEDRSIEKFSSDINSLIDNTPTSNYEVNTNYPILMDNGNCHERYYESYMNNLNYYVNLMRNNVYVTTSRIYLNNNELKLLDLVNLIPNDPSKNEPLDPLSGKYIITQKVSRIDKNAGFSHRFKLSRDFALRY